MLVRRAHFGWSALASTGAFSKSSYNVYRSILYRTIDDIVHDFKNTTDDII